MLALACNFSAAAEGWGYRTGFDLRYGSQQLKNTDDGILYDSDKSFGFSFDGTQFQFHKKPIGGLAYIGLDFGLSCDFANYKAEVDNNYQRGSSLIEGFVSSAVFGGNGMMQVDLGIPVGPYIKVAPFAGKGNTDFRVSAYYHIVPSASVIVLNDSYAYAFKPFNAFGALVGWTFISVGFEIRNGAATYRCVTSDDFNDEFNLKTAGVTKNFATANKSLFLRLSF